MCWKVQLDGVVIVADEVGRSHDIEGDDEQPKERTYPDSQKRQDGKQPGREVTVSGQVGEAGRQIVDNPRKDEDQPEEAKASANPPPPEDGDSSWAPRSNRLGRRL